MDHKDNRPCRVIIHSEISNQERKVLEICAIVDVRIIKVLPITKGYSVICPTIGDVEKLFSDKSTKLFSDAETRPNMPPYIRSNRTILVFRVDDLIFSRQVEGIKNDIERRND